MCLPPCYISVFLRLNTAFLLLRTQSFWRSPIFIISSRASCYTHASVAYETNDTFVSPDSVWCYLRSVISFNIGFKIPWIEISSKYMETRMTYVVCMELSFYQIRSTPFSFHTEAETRWPTFRRQHFQRHFFNEDILISIDISLKFVSKDQINNILALVQIMAWHRRGEKPLSGPMMIIFPTHVCVTRPQVMVSDIYIMRGGRGRERDGQTDKKGLGHHCLPDVLILRTSVRTAFNAKSDMRVNFIAVDDFKKVSVI